MGSQKIFKKLINIELLELQKKTYNLSRNFIDRSFYNVQIKRYLKLFDKKNMFFIHFEEDFIQNRAQTIKNVFKFLQVNEKEKIGKYPYKSFYTFVFL